MASTLASAGVLGHDRTIGQVLEAVVGDTPSEQAVVAAGQRAER